MFLSFSLMHCHMTVHGVYTGISTVAVIKVFTSQIQCLFEGNVYLKVEHVIKNFGIIIFHIKQTELTSFDFD